MERILITGVQGFVGRYLLAHWLAVDPAVEIQGIGRSKECPDSFTHTVHWAGAALAAPLPAPLRIKDCDRFRYSAMDVLEKTELIDLLRQFRPDGIIHLASLLPGAGAWELFRTNVGGTLSLMEAIAESHVGIEKLVISSSSAVYGAPSDGDLPLSEGAACMPIDQYGASKLAAEHASRILAVQERIPAVWARTFNVVGPGQHETHLFGMVARSIGSISTGVSPHRLRVGSLDATRDYADVRDVASGLRLLAKQGRPGNVYNLASGKETSARSLVQLFMDVAGLAHLEIEQETEAPRIPRHFAFIGRIEALGFRQSRSLQQSVADTLNYYQYEVAHAPELPVQMTQ